MLAPLALAVVVSALTKKVRWRTFMLAGAFALIAVTLQPADWGRSAWSDSYLGVQAQTLPPSQSTLVLVSGYEPMAYIIPFFPPEVRFLRIHGYMTGPSSHPHALDHLMHTIIAAHKGPLYSLHRPYEAPAAHHALEFHGLARSDTNCREILPSVEPSWQQPFFLCNVFPSNNPSIERNRIWLSTLPPTGSQ